MDRETELKEQLRALQEEYDAKAKPIVDELAEIESSKPPRVVIVSLDDLEGGDLFDLLFGKPTPKEGCNCEACTAARKAMN
jgi:hypothetical protein